MPKVVVAGSDFDSSLVVIDFTTPGSPSFVPANPSAIGCRPVLSGDRLFVGVLRQESCANRAYEPRCPVARLDQHCALQHRRIRGIEPGQRGSREWSQ